jgi:hypothetical protein
MDEETTADLQFLASISKQLSSLDHDFDSLFPKLRDQALPEERTYLDHLTQALTPSRQSVKEVLEPLERKIAQAQSESWSSPFQRIQQDLMAFEASRIQQEQETREKQDAEWEIERRVRSLLRDNDYTFIQLLAPTEYFAPLLSVDARVQRPLITTKVRKVTCTTEFENRVEDIFQSMPALRRHWKVMKEALYVHRDGNYILSIPVLFLLLESVINECMLYYLTATRKSGKFLSRKLNVKGVKPELKGLVPKLQTSKFETYTSFYRDVNAIGEKLAIERNGILHGVSTSYATAKLSTQLVVLIFGMAWVLSHHYAYKPNNDKRRKVMRRK